MYTSLQWSVVIKYIRMDSNLNVDVEDNGSDLLAEELARLQRQYMLMESNKKAYTEEMGSCLTKQKWVWKNTICQKRRLKLYKYF